MSSEEKSIVIILAFTASFYLSHCKVKSKLKQQKTQIMPARSIDRFKLVNDSFSHQIGDELLKAIAKRMKQSLRGEDTLARQGGDEFVVVVRGLKKEKEIEKVATKLISIFEKPFKIAKRDIVIGASVGITFYPHDGKSAGRLLRNADVAMYQAKRLGGNQFQLYSTEFNKVAILRFERENELRHALEKNELIFYCTCKFTPPSLRPYVHFSTTIYA